MAESGWSQLPGDILTMIVELLNTQIDTIHIRSVCHSWRLSIPPFKHIPSFPLTLPFPISPNPHLNQDRCGHFTLLHNSFYLALPPPQKNDSNSHKPWLFRVEESGNGKRRPLNPLSRVLSENVPQYFPKVLNLLDFPVFEISRGFSLDYVETSDKPIETCFNELKSLVVKKVVVSSNSFTADSNNFEIAVIHGGKLGFIRLGDEKWSLVDDAKPYDDVIYHKGKFYAVDVRGNTVVIGPDLKAKQVASPFPYGGGQFKKLAQFGKDLYLLDKHMDPEIPMSFDDFLQNVINPDVVVHYEVYKLNEEQKEWERVNSLGDKLVFEGDDCSFVVSAQDFVGLKSNCIYFSDDSFACENPDTACLYEMEDETCGPLSSFNNSYSRILWPPPSWLQTNKTSSFNERE